MRHTLATVGTVLLVSLAMTGCGGGDGAKKASVSPSTESTTATELPTDLPTAVPTGLASCLPTGLPTDLSSGLPSDLPTDLAGCLPTDLPTGVPTDLPTDVPTTAATATGGMLDACAVVTAKLLTADLGVAQAGQSLSQASSYGDPNAKDCYYIGGAATVVVQATTRADADMPESSNNYEGLPGAEQVPGVDRGWVFAQSAQGSTTASLILVKGQHGINASIITSGSTVTLAQLQKLARDVLPAL